MMDIGIYALQAARYLSAEEPTEVNALIYTTPNDPRFKEVEENINFQLRFPSGILANCTSSYGYDAQSHYRVIGTKGWLEMEPATVYRDLRIAVHSKVISAEGSLPPTHSFILKMGTNPECAIENNKRSHH